MKRTAKIGVFVAAAVLASTAGIYFGTKYPSKQRTAASGAQVPAAGAAAFFAQVMPDGDGKQISMAEYRGKLVVVNFWAPWCDPCVEEIPEFSRLQTEFESKGVRFVGIGIDNAENISKFRSMVAPVYPLVVAPEAGSTLAREFGNAAGALPFTVLLNKSGEVVATKMGKVSEKELRDWLSRMVEVS